MYPEIQQELSAAIQIFSEKEINNQVALANHNKERVAEE
jgi:hypothetical protein